MKRLFILCALGVFAISSVKTDVVAQDHKIDRSHETMDCRFAGSTCSVLPPIIIVGP